MYVGRAANTYRRSVTTVGPDWSPARLHFSLPVGLIFDISMAAYIRFLLFLMISAAHLRLYAPCYRHNIRSQAGLPAAMKLGWLDITRLSGHADRHFILPQNDYVY